MDTWKNAFFLQENLHVHNIPRLGGGIGQETKHVKIGHVKIDRAHFCVHFREHWKISREHSRGSLRGDPLVWFTQKNLNLRGHFRGHLRVHSRVHFREHFRERVRGSDFAVRMLCTCLRYFGFGLGGGECRFYLYGRGDFSEGRSPRVGILEGASGKTGPLRSPLS